MYLAVGFNVETLRYGNIDLTVWDVGGQDKIRKLWQHYFTGTNGLIFVVDSNDVDRMSLACHELHKLLDDHELRDAVLLVYANKQDLPNALPTCTVADKLELTELRGRKWYVQGCSAVTGDGLYEGLDWMAKTLTARS